MIFMHVSRILGVFPFQRNGSFNILLYFLFVLQMLSMIYIHIIPVTVERLETLVHQKMLRFFISTGTSCVYYTGPCCHAILLLWFKKDFEKLALFIKYSDGSSRMIKYFNHIGLSGMIFLLYNTVHHTVSANRYFNHEDHFKDTLNRLVANHIFTLDYLIMAQHSAFVWAITQELTKASKLLQKTSVLQALNRRNAIMPYLSLINKIYGPQIIFRVFQAFVTCVGSAYRNMSDMKSYSAKSTLDKTGEAAIICMIVGELFCYCGTCEVARHRVSRRHS